MTAIRIALLIPTNLQVSTRPFLPLRLLARESNTSSASISKLFSPGDVLLSPKPSALQSD